MNLPHLRADTPAPHLPGALCAGRHPTLRPDDWLRPRRDETTVQAEQSCRVLCPELDACRAYADRWQPSSGVWAGLWRG